MKGHKEMLMRNSCLLTDSSEMVVNSSYMIHTIAKTIFDTFKRTRIKQSLIK